MPCSGPASPASFLFRVSPVALVALLGIFSGCDAFEPKDPGARLYQRLCSSCHGTDGRGNTVRYMSDEWADLTDGSWRTYGDDGTLEGVIREGVFSKMPAHGDLSQEEMRALLDHLRKLRGEAAE